jgi:hypothetical protein
MMQEELLPPVSPAIASRSSPTSSAPSRPRLARSEPGDLLVMFADNISRSWKQIIRFRDDGGHGHGAAPAALSTVGSMVGFVEGPTEVETGGQRTRHGELTIEDQRGVRIAARESED